MQVGDRIVVRQEEFDTIGHVLSVEPLIVRPHARGGLPSNAEPVRIDNPLMIKRLSPRTVRNADIRAIEVATAKAFPVSNTRGVGSGCCVLATVSPSVPTQQPPWAHKPCLHPCPTRKSRNSTAGTTCQR